MFKALKQQATTTTTAMATTTTKRGQKAMRNEKHATKQHNLNFAHASVSRSLWPLCNMLLQHANKQQPRNPVADAAFASIRFALNENEIIALLTMRAQLDCSLPGPLGQEACSPDAATDKPC